ncbi:hypothetical protein DMN91_003504 [Ooceraea biroi]|uniref:CCHC-type domain-containing protein n=1 Tax=Ooceraea biroi TaxID=2015173 RepID=A0A3L8DS90_OOCBI|nr:hypothetical protein DMN91_003504 [Ooceraea biroi]
MAEVSGLPAIAKLKGRENYTTWKIAMKNLSQLDGLWKAVLGTETNEDKRAKAKAKIILSVNEVLYVHVAGSSTVQEAWTNLEKVFQNKGLTRKVDLLRKITTTRIENCDSMEQYINEIMSTAHQLTGMGFEINQEWLGTALLAGLSEHFQPMIMALESSGMPITGDSIKMKLLQETNCASSSRSASDDSAFHAKRQSKRNKSAQKPKNAVKCWSCNKSGHFASDCEETKKVEKDKRRADRGRKKSEGSSKVAFLASKHSSTQSARWIIDSAASAHMSHNKDLLNSFVEIGESKVVVANNNKLKVRGKGTADIPIEVNGQARIAVAEEVLYVSELSVNLLSVRKLTEKGLVVKFNKHVCTITDKSGNLVALAKPVNGIYELSQSVNAVYSCKSVKSTIEWHRRLGHLSKSILSQTDTYVW